MRPRVPYELALSVPQALRAAAYYAEKGADQPFLTLAAEKWLGNPGVVQASIMAFEAWLVRRRLAAATLKDSSAQQRAELLRQAAREIA